MTRKNKQRANKNYFTGRSTYPTESYRHAMEGGETRRDQDAKREKKANVQNGNRSCKKHLGQKAPRLNGRRGTDVQISLRGGGVCPLKGGLSKRPWTPLPSLQQKKRSNSFRNEGVNDDRKIRNSNVRRPERATAMIDNY